MIATHRSCHLCKSSRVEELLDLGLQPVCNRFLSRPDEEEFKHPMRLGFCSACGIPQLMDPVPVAELRPRFDWITYAEPERHVNRMADTIARLPGLGKNSVCYGVSFKDDSILTALAERGLGRTRRLDVKTDLDIEDSRAGVETVQDRLTPERCHSLAKTLGPADVVVARHILEHSRDVFRFMSALRGLLNPSGYLVLEVPDCARALENLDYSTIWEEHVLYFTPWTFKRAMTIGGFSSVHFEVFPYAPEDVLVCIGRFSGSASPPPAGMEQESLELEKNRAFGFRDGLAGRGEKFRRYFFDHRIGPDEVAVFGAGHLSCVFINLLGLAGQIDFVVDDHPQKQGLFMPGNHRPIRGPAALADGRTRLCLLGINADSEPGVIGANGRYAARGGTFASIFPASPNALRVS